MRGGKLAGPLSHRYAMPDSPFCRLRDIFPRPGEVFPQRESPWHGGKVSGQTVTPSGFARGSLFEGAAARSAAEGVIRVRTPSVIAARCHLPHGGRLWQCGKVSGQTVKLAGALAPLGGAVAQRLRGFKSAEPEKTVKRSSRRTGVNLQFFPVGAHFFRIVKGEQPLARCGVGGVQR